MTRSVLLALIGLVLAGQPVFSQQTAESSEVEQYVQTALRGYVEAFNRGDAAAVAAFWSEQGEYVAPDGETSTGRKAIEEAFTTLFAEQQGLQLEVDVPTVRLEKPDVAIEEGVAIVLREGEPPRMTRYVATHVKENGSWKLKSVREADAPAEPPSHFEQLQALDWMVGDWIDQEEESSIRTTCRWTKNGNFLTRSFQVSIGDAIELEGTQVIGWDPLRQTIRSWVFDSDGGFGVGLWTQQGDRWVIKQLQVLYDGRQASATNMIQRIDDNTFTWQSIGRELDGQMLPNIKEVTIVRAPSEDDPVPAGTPSETGETPEETE